LRWTGLVEAAEEAFDTNSFMVATRSSVKTDAKKLTSFAENTAESASSINNDEATHADFKEHFLKQKASDFMRIIIIEDSGERQDGRDECRACHLERLERIDERRGASWK
jgi:hypothetical protein